MKIKKTSRTGSEKKARRRNVLRMTVSYLLLLVCAVPMFGGRVQPLSVIPALFCIIMREDLYFTAFCSVTAGFLIDSACGSVLGANAVFLLICSVFAWLLFSQLLRRRFLSYFLLTAACILLRCCTSYLCTQVLMRVPDRGVLWRTVLLPSAGLTLLTALPVYLLYLPFAKHLTRQVRSMDAAAVRRDW